MTDRYDEVLSFLGSLEGEHVKFLALQLSISGDMKNMIAEFKLTESQFCDLMAITGLHEYQAYISGGICYSVRDIAKMRSVWADLAAKKAYDEKQAQLEKEGIQLTK